jgi:hypothetical protein
MKYVPAWIIFLAVLGYVYIHFIAHVAVHVGKFVIR